MAYRLLVIDDRLSEAEASFDHVLSAQAGFCCEHVPWDSFTGERLSATKAQLVVALAVMEPARAFSLFQWIRGHPIAAPMLAVVPDDSEEGLLQIAAETADDFILWPLRENELRQRVERMIGARGHDVESARLRLTQEMGLAHLVGTALVFKQTIEKIPLIAASDAPVLLLGETGTGKELCARAIHHLSMRSNFPFIPVECGALPEHLAENELFGHARGAFTDAHADQRGLAAMAERGTLFLDEIEALSTAVQAKLLRFLEEGTYRALGSDRFARANVRVLAATNRDLELCVNEKQFRSDLYFRLNVLQLRLPPLRERREDISVLARHFLRSVSESAGAGPKSFSPSALRMLERHDWPGNVRELHNVVRGAIVFCSGSQILPCHLAVPASVHPLPCVPTRGFREARLRAIESFERVYLEEMLRKHGGNITRAAAEAHKDRRAFGRLVKKYGVDRKLFLGRVSSDPARANCD